MCQYCDPAYKLVKSMLDKISNTIVDEKGNHTVAINAAVLVASLEEINKILEKNYKGEKKYGN